MRDRKGRRREEDDDDEEEKTNLHYSQYVYAIVRGSMNKGGWLKAKAVQFSTYEEVVGTTMQNQKLNKHKRKMKIEKKKEEEEEEENRWWYVGKGRRK